MIHLRGGGIETQSTYSRSISTREVPSVVCVVIRTHAPSRLRYILRGERAKLRPRLGVQDVFLYNSTGGPQTYCDKQRHLMTFVPFYVTTVSLKKHCPQLEGFLFLKYIGSRVFLNIRRDNERLILLIIILVYEVLCESI